MDASVTLPPKLDLSETRPRSAHAWRNRCSRIKPTKPQDPALWDKEVVTALCTRLPGGISSVTKPCRVCKSIFYPCLCEPRPGSSGLRAPKVVRAAEECRLSICNYPPKLTGSLNSVQSRAERQDLNTDRLIVLSDEGMGIVRRCLKTGQVLSREAAEYVVCTDGQSHTQTLSFTWQELEQLEHCLERRKDSHLVVKARVDSKLVTVRYNTRNEARGDLVLTRVPAGWEVHETKEGGIASTACISKGHLLSHLHILSCEWEDTWHEQAPPYCLCSHEDMAASGQPDDARAFPCELTFERLPIGSCGKTINRLDGKGEATRLTWHSLRELIASQSGAAIVFEHALQEFVSRESVLCRHEHLWEKRPEDWTAEDDARLLRLWVFGARLTLASLSFVFKKLTDLIVSEMQRFERAKHLRLQLLLDKCRRCVELQKPHDPGIGHSLISGEVKFLLREVHAIFEAVPTYFLKEISGESSVPVSSSSRTITRSAKPTFTRRGSTFTEIANQLASDAISDADPEVLDFLVEQVRQYLAHTKEFSWKQSSARSTRRSTSLGAVSTGTLGRSASGFQIEQQNDPAAWRIQRATARCNNETMTLAEEELDGRVSEKEFERLLIKAGITWLTRAQQRLMFDSLDQDRTGKLNLGEVLSTAGRIMELLHRATAYHEEHHRDKPSPQAEFLKEFCRTHFSADESADRDSVDQDKPSPRAEITQEFSKTQFSVDESAYKVSKD